MEMLELDAIQFRELKSHLKLLPVLKLQIATLKEEKECLISLIHKLKAQLRACRCPKTSTNKTQQIQLQHELNAADEEVLRKFGRFEYGDYKQNSGSICSRSSTEGDDDQHSEMCEDTSVLLSDDLSSKLSFVDSLSSQTSVQSSGGEYTSSVSSPSASLKSNHISKSHDKQHSQGPTKSEISDWAELFGINRTLCDAAIQTEDEFYQKNYHKLEDEEMKRSGSGDLVEWTDFQSYFVKSVPTKSVATMTHSPAMRSIGISAIPLKGSKENLAGKNGSASPKLSTRTVKLKSITSLCASKSAESIHSNVIQTTSNGTNKNSPTAPNSQDNSSQKVTRDGCPEIYHQYSSCHSLSSSGLVLPQSLSLESKECSEELKCVVKTESELSSLKLYTIKPSKPRFFLDDVLLHLRSMQIKLKSSSSVDVAPIVHTEWLKLIKDPEVTAEEIDGFLKSVTNFAGADVCQLIVQSKDEHHNSALHYLIGRNNFRAVQILLSTNWVRCNDVNQAGFSVAQMACVSCPEKPEDLAVLKLLFSKSQIDQVQRTSGKSLLMMACVEDNIEIAEILCDLGADVNLQDNQGFTALMFAAENGNEHLAKLLLRKGSCDVALCNAEGQNAVMIALNVGCKQIALQIYSSNLHKSPTASMTKFG